MKAIKQRRASVTNMQQAMRAMNLVATAKLQRARTEWQQIQAFISGTDTAMRNVAMDERVATHLCVQGHESPGRNALYLVISSDRGKCGGYNLNAAKKALTHAAENNKNAQYVVIGAKGYEYFTTRGHTAQCEPAPKSQPSYTEAQAFAKMLLNAYSSQDDEQGADEVYIVYTKFTSILATEPTVVQVLPLNARLVDVNENTHKPMLYDPDPGVFIDHMMPIYLAAFIYGTMMESVVCEQAARMLNMDAATNNAQEIIEDLTLMFNRQRQGAITQEITEIVSGANALN